MATDKKVTITPEVLGPIYVASMEKKHNWAKFVSAVQAKKPGISEETIKQKLSYLKSMGVEIESFEGQALPRGKQSTDFKSIADLFGAKFNKAKLEETKKRNKEAYEKAKAEKAKGGT